MHTGRRTRPKLCLETHKNLDEEKQLNSNCSRMLGRNITNKGI